MGCSQPVVWVARCNTCGKEICRFCSKPPDDWQLGKPLPKHQLAYRNGTFSSHIKNYCKQYMDFPGKDAEQKITDCCSFFHVEIVSQPWTHLDMLVFIQELGQTAKVVSESAHKLGQLRKYTESGKIDTDSFDVMYTNLVAIMESMKMLLKERVTNDYFKEEVKNVEF